MAQPHEKKISFAVKMAISIAAMLLLGFAMLGAAVVTSYSGDRTPLESPDSTSLYFKDVECTITSVDSRWVITQWIVDIEYENEEYGLSGSQRLTARDAQQFHDATVGEHIAVEMFSTVRDSDGEIVERHLGKIVISAGHDPTSVTLR